MRREFVTCVSHWRRPGRTILMKSYFTGLHSPTFCTSCALRLAMPNLKTILSRRALLPAWMLLSDVTLPMI